jgi:hypothetical protein
MQKGYCTTLDAYGAVNKMILSFSVPDHPKYESIINWYRNQDGQERSREFRNIFLAYLGNPHQITEKKESTHISHNVEIQRIELSKGNDEEEDFDSKLNHIGYRR